MRIVRDTKRKPPEVKASPGVSPDTAKEVRRAKMRDGKSIGEIANDFKLSRSTVSAIVNFKGKYRV